MVHDLELNNSLKKKKKGEEKKDDGKRKNIVEEEEKKDHEKEGQPWNILKNGHLHGIFHFVTHDVNVLSVCYIYENFQK